ASLWCLTEVISYETHVILCFAGYTDPFWLYACIYIARRPDSNILNRAIYRYAITLRHKHYFRDNYSYAYLFASRYLSKSPPVAATGALADPVHRGNFNGS
ncbi:MAG: hypothetical protein ACK8QZ_10285, partial [Anaerolineales bacterium]